MFRHKTFGKLLALTLGLAVFAPGLTAEAKKGPKKEVAAAGPATVQSAITLSPKGLRWAKTHEEVAKAYDAALEKDFLKRLQEAQPGPELEQVQSELAETQAAFRRSYSEFGDVPSRLDGTPMANEYTYKNQEAVMSIKRDGKERYLFFIQDQLWKVIDVYKLGEKRKFGPTFQTAQKKLEKLLGVPGRARPADPEANRNYPECDWADEQTHLRAVDWGNGQVALTYTSKNTLAQLSTLRSFKPEPEPELDPAVKQVIRK